ncbi:ribonuclease H [Rhizobium mongolense]|uniref:ribonuclease H n=1 Tax=Rhizobium mongolense TaxID=57676 RepID=UPI0034A25728
MSKLNWDKAKKHSQTISLADEEDFKGRDAAARWLKRHEHQAAKKSPKQKNRNRNVRREDKRAGPVDGRSGLVIYTDGACEPNPGRGGWGFVVYDAGVETHVSSGGEVASTNNIMEMTGVKMALEWLHEQRREATIISDSQYVVKGCNEWRFGWKARGWRRYVDRKTGKMEPVKNSGLWQEIDELLRSVTVKIEWCKGHAGIVGNERADELSNTGRKQIVAEASRLKGIEVQLSYSI